MIRVDRLLLGSVELSLDPQRAEPPCIARWHRGRDALALSACYEGAVTQRVGLGPQRGRPVLSAPRWRSTSPPRTGAWKALMERLAAQIPKPRVNLVLYAGVLAPHARLRARAVVHDRPEPRSPPPATDTQTRGERDTWAELMRATFGLDVLECRAVADA